MPTPSAGDQVTVIDADVLVSFEEGNGPGRDIFSTLTDNDAVAIPDPVWDEVRRDEFTNDPWRLESPGGGRARWGSHLDDEGQITTAGPDEACRDAWADGRAVVVRQLAVDRLPDGIVAHLRNNHPERFDDGTVDLTSAGRPGSPYTADPRLFVDVDGGGLPTQETRLGRGESAAILTAYAVGGELLSNDANARTVAAAAGVDETDLLHALGAAVSEDRVTERRANSFVRNWARNGDFLDARIDSRHRARKLTVGSVITAVHGRDTARSYDEQWVMPADSAAETKYTTGADSGPPTGDAASTDGGNAPPADADDAASPDSGDTESPDPDASSPDTKYSVDSPTGLRESGSGEDRPDSLTSHLDPEAEADESTDETTRSSSERR